MVDFSKVSGLENVALAKTAKAGNVETSPEYSKLPEMIAGEKESYTMVTSGKTKKKEPETVHADFATEYNTEKYHQNNALRAMKSVADECEKKGINDKATIAKLQKQALRNQFVGRVIYDSSRRAAYEIKDVVVPSGEGDPYFKKDCLTKYVEQKNGETGKDAANFASQKDAFEAMKNAESREDRLSLLGNTFRRPSGAKAVITGWETNNKSGETKPVYDVLSDYNYNDLAKSLPIEYNENIRNKNCSNKASLQMLREKYVGKTVYNPSDGNMYSIKGISTNIKLEIVLESKYKAKA
jgi:hypothetical protein